MLKYSMMVYERKTMEKYIQYIKDFNFNGHIQIEKDQGILLCYSKGFRNYYEELSINSDTKFGIASGTKLFTALLILILIEKGFFSLNTLAYEILPIEKPGYNKNITIKHLLTHTSGMPDYFDEDLIEDFDTFELAKPNHKLVTPKDYLKIFPDRVEDFKPGLKYKYNNGAFVYLGAIIEEVTGLSFKEAIHEHLVKPLNLKHTGVYSFDALPKNTTLGYYKDQGTLKSNIYKLPIQSGADGGLYTNARDMKKVWGSLFKGHIVSKTLLNDMMTPQVLIDSKKEIYYGLGVYLKKVNDGYSPYIIGGDVGVSFRSSYQPVTKGYLFAVSNRSNDIWRIYDNLLGIEKELRK